MLIFEHDFVQILIFFSKTGNLDECLTICQAAGTQECDNQEKIHSDLLVKKKSWNQKLHYQINNCNLECVTNLKCVTNKNKSKCLTSDEEFRTHIVKTNGQIQCFNDYKTIQKQYMINI